MAALELPWYVCAFPSCSGWAHCGDFSDCWALGLGLTDSVVVAHGLNCPKAYGTFWVGRHILNQWTIWGVLHLFFFLIFYDHFRRIWKETILILEDQPWLWCIMSVFKTIWSHPHVLTLQKQRRWNWGNVQTTFWRCSWYKEAGSTWKEMWSQGRRD